VLLFPSVCIDDHVNTRVDEHMAHSELMIVTIVRRMGRRKGHHKSFSGHYEFAM
jgi:hypothetical protein